jgi:hypothetical protein
MQRKPLRLTILLALLMLWGAHAAQAQRNCGTMEYLQQEIDADPGRGALLDAIDAFTQDLIAEQEPGTERSVITIPVVFHVVWRTTAENIPDARILAQLQQLNDDFARLNSDAGNTPSFFQGVAANTQIQFCLAQRDPSGNATNGIVRRQTTVTSFSTNNAVKYTANGGSNAWPRDSYLNIWTCNLSSGLLGYAQFPGGTAATDGVVVLHSSVGSLNTPGTATNFNYGRTLTHEVGHWLNLRHIWGDATCGNDQVADTPVHQTSNGGCPAFPKNNTCGGTTNTEMTMNYMDYTNDACMNIFTLGQRDRMRALFAAGGARAALLNSMGCVPPGGTTCAVPTGTTTSSITTTSAVLSWNAVAGAASYDVRYRTAGTTTWSQGNVTGTSANFTGLSVGTSYEWGVRANCGGGSSDFSATVTFSTLSATCPVPSGLAASNITATGATLSWAAVGGATSYDLRYKPTAASSWTTVNTTATSTVIGGLSAGTAYEAQVRTNCTGTSSAFSASATFSTASGCTDTWEPNNSATAAPLIPVNTNIQGLISSGTDNDWFRFNNTTAQRRIRIDLTNLPADYDVRLFRGTNTQVGISQNGGTSNEVIILNTNNVATYYIRVYGYNGAFNASQCYTLRASISGTNFREEEATMVLDDLAFDEASPTLLHVFPNPASHKLMMDYAATGFGALTLTVFDAMGRQQLSTVQPVAPGPATYGIPVDHLPPGMYVLHVQDGDHHHQQRFMVQR